MPDHLYRFRSTEYLLGEDYRELERQEIFFAATDKLNDPMEGYLEVVWQGDEILWANLLRHYLLTLLQSSVAASVFPDFTPDLCTDLVWSTRQDALDDNVRELHEALWQAVRKTPWAKAFVRELGRLDRSVGRDELTFYLQNAHPLAFDELNQILIARGHVPAESVSPRVILARGEAGFLNQMRTLPKLLSKDDDKTRAAFASARNSLEQMALIQAYTVATKGSEEPEGWKFLTRGFPGFYVPALEALVYPRWRVACFAETPTNASMWGVYGDGHKGACLIFKPRESATGYGLTMTTLTGWGGKVGDVRPAPSTGFRTFEKVRYSYERPTVEFFTSLGQLPRFKLQDWIQNEAGTTSPLVRMLDEEDDGWRKAYWDTFHKSLALKTPEWAHEAEHRLVLSSLLTSSIPPERAKGAYDFDDLAGIIFGARTPEAEKIEIIKIIEAKCRAAGRKTFEFHQARYGLGGDLQIIPLTLLKFDFNEEAPPR